MKKMTVIVLMLAAMLTMALGVNLAMGSTRVSACGQFHNPPAGLEGPFGNGHDACHELQHSGVQTSFDIPVDSPVAVPAVPSLPVGSPVAVPGAPVDVPDVPDLPAGVVPHI